MDGVWRVHPNEWLVVEALEAHSIAGRRVFERIAVVEVCPDGATAHNRYRTLHGTHPDREFYFVHTANEELEIEERPWVVCFSAPTIATGEAAAEMRAKLAKVR